MRKDEEKALMRIAQDNAKQTEKMMQSHIRPRSGEAIKKYRREPKGPASLLSTGG